MRRVRRSVVQAAQSDLSLGFGFDTGAVSRIATRQKQTIIAAKRIVMHRALCHPQRAVEIARLIGQLRDFVPQGGA